MTDSREGIIPIHGGEVDLRREVAVRDGGTLRLTTLEARLLAYLVDRAGETCARDELQTEVWGYHPDVETRAVDHAIRRLRAKIELDPRRPRHVLKVHGEGYRFEPLAQAAPETAAAPERAAGAAPRGGVGAAPLVGRDEELATLFAAVTEPGLVTLVGPGGVGKTRLARALWEARGDAVWCDLAYARDAAAVVDAVARGLQVDLPVERDVVARLGHALAGRGDAWVILDNAEQVVAPVAAALGSWTRAAPGVRFVVTTREALRLPGERVVAVAPLPEDAATELFVTRARALDPGVTDHPDVRALVRRLDGLPLAITLASARVRVLTPRAMLGRLDRRFQVLAAAPGAAVPDRHRTLRAALDWSWELLDGDEQAALAQLSVLRGFDVDAAEAIVALPSGEGAWVVDVLEALIEKSLVQRRGGRDHGRLELLESVAHYAGERLATAHAATSRHRHYFAARARAAMAALRTPEVASAREWLEREQANLLEALSRADGEAADAASLALALDAALTLRGPLDLHQRVLERGVAAAGAEPRAEALLLTRRATLRLQLGQVAEARADLERAAALAAGDVEAEGPLAIAAGQLHRRLGDVTAARAAFERAGASADAAGDVLGRADALTQLGSLLHERDLLAEARPHYDAALALYRAAGDRGAAASVLGRLGTLAMEIGELGAAEAHLLEAMDIQRTLGDSRLYASHASNLAVLLHDDGRLDASEARWREALAIHRRVGNRRFEGFALAGLGLLEAERGALDAASRTLRRALVVFTEAADPRFAAVARARIAAVELLRGHLAEAAATLAEAEAAFEALRVPWAGAALRWLERLLVVARDGYETDAVAALAGEARTRLTAAASGGASDARPWSFERLTLRLVLTALTR